MTTTWHTYNDYNAARSFDVNVRKLNRWLFARIGATLTQHGLVERNVGRTTYLGKRAVELAQQDIWAVFDDSLARSKVADSHCHKHVLEAYRRRNHVDADDVYVSNGDFIAACLFEGVSFSVTRRNDTIFPNCTLDMTPLERDAAKK